MPLQILQSPGNFAIVYQENHAFRVFHPEGRPHFDATDWWMGDTRYRWDGDTLVADVAAMTDLAWLDQAGNFHTTDFHVVEGVSGNTIGQWARWGYIRPSQSTADPHVYSVEDVAEAAVVHELLDRGVRHRTVRRAFLHLADYGEWPLSAAPLATTRDGRLVLLREDGDVYALSPRGWQLMAAPPDLDEVHLRLRRS